MSNSCLTLEGFLTWSGTEFVTFGANSTGDIEVSTTGLVGETITVGGVVFTGVAGARTSGSNDFSIDPASAALLAVELVAALSDPLNGAAAIVTTTLRTPGVAIVDLTSVSTGVYSLIPVETNTPATYVLSAATLTGGDEMLVDLLTCTCAMLPAACWGNKRSCAHEYLAAHFITVASGGSGGTVSSKKIDKISISYAVSPPSDPDLGSTKYGLLYLALRQSIVRFGAVSGNSNMVGWVC